MNGRIVIAWIAAAVIIIATARSLRVEPPRSVFLPFGSDPLPELCSFRHMLKIDCPGCGMTRSFIFASRFQCSNAWNSNPAGILLFASIVLSIPWRLTQWFCFRMGRPFRSPPFVEAGCLTVIAIIMMLQWTFKILL